MLCIWKGGGGSSSNDKPLKKNPPNRIKILFLNSFSVVFFYSFYVVFWMLIKNCLCVSSWWFYILFFHFYFMLFWAIVLNNFNVQLLVIQINMKWFTFPETIIIVIIITKFTFACYYVAMLGSFSSRFYFFGIFFRGF